MKPISFVVNTDPSKPALKPYKVEYPELEELLNQGYEIIDTLPSYGSGNSYFVTFILEEPVKPRGSVHRAKHRK